ncbi:MAG: glucose-6-phosphate isomerase [Kiritimatiellia bacterium]|jgi:glucose-6-phosphate isomerase
MPDIIHDCFSQLQAHQSQLKSSSLGRLFEEDSQRVDALSIQVDGLYLDYSKNHITSETINMLCEYALKRKLPTAIQALFSGKHVNNTEDRPALHTALRFQGEAVTAEQKLVADSRKKMAACVKKIHSQRWLGFTGKPIDTIINIGIGGSDLGPRMVVQALSAYKQSVDVKFVANIDGADICDMLETVDPATTLFIITSKSFTTPETLQNALSARQWIQSKGCDKDQLNQHFIAISANISATKAFGIHADNTFPLWDWVGGRYSLWSTVGLSIAIAIGMDNFNLLLLGAHQMDEHYARAKLEHNLPVIAGLLSFWYSQCWGSKTHAILPYAQRLSRLPTYLQQLDMESLGKSVSREGKPLDYSTGNIIWGAEGSNGQHSFHQLLHQGTDLISVDFIAVKKPMSGLEQQHAYLQACCISQSQALLKGKTLADAKQELRDQGVEEEEINLLAPHKVISGNKPSNTIIVDELNPKNLGALIAFYEHKVYTLSVLLDINAFDQWGVELGKQLGEPILLALSGKPADHQWDDSTKALIQKLSLV